MDIFCEKPSLIESSLFELLNKLQEHNDSYYDYDKILNDFQNSLIKHNKGMMNRCVSCNIDLGYNNPRQYCCKTYCPYETQ